MSTPPVDSAPTDERQKSDPVDTAWKIHAAHIDWTGKVDSKANFVLAIESAMFAGVLRVDLAILASTHSKWAFGLGVASLVVALFFVLLVVAPRLRTSRLEAETKENFIFFGHVKNWSADDLVAALKARDILPVLSRQIVTMAGIAWTKHRRLQGSILGAVIAAALFGLSALCR